MFCLASSSDLWATEDHQWQQTERRREIQRDRDGQRERETDRDRQRQRHRHRKRDITTSRADWRPAIRSALITLPVCLPACLSPRSKLASTSTQAWTQLCEDKLLEELAQCLSLNLLGLDRRWHVWPRHFQRGCVTLTKRACYPSHTRRLITKKCLPILLWCWRKWV